MAAAEAWVISGVGTTETFFVRRGGHVPCFVYCAQTLSAPSTEAIAEPIATPLWSRSSLLSTSSSPASSIARSRSEEHTSELQSQFHLVCRLLLEKKKRRTNHATHLRTP